TRGGVRLRPQHPHQHPAAQGRHRGHHHRRRRARPRPRRRPLHDVPSDPRPGRLLTGPEAWAFSSGTGGMTLKPATIQVGIALVLATVLAVLAIIWIAPAVGLKNSACERYPYTSGCR